MSADIHAHLDAMAETAKADADRFGLPSPGGRVLYDMAFGALLLAWRMQAITTDEYMRRWDALQGDIRSRVKEQEAA